MLLLHIAIQSIQTQSSRIPLEMISETIGTNL